MAIILFEKGDDWPVCIFRNPLRWIVSKINRRLSELFDCPVCMSFWSTLLCDILLFFIFGGVYFLWLLSGFAAMGLTWWMYENFHMKDKIVQNLSNRDISSSPKGSDQNVIERQD